MDGIWSKSYFRKLVLEQELFQKTGLGEKRLIQWDSNYGILWDKRPVGEEVVDIYPYTFCKGRVPVVSSGKLTEASGCTSRVPLKSVE